MMKLDRSLFLNNMEDIVRQVEKCIEVKNMGTKVTKIAYSQEDNMGLLSYTACGICGIKYIFISEDKIIVRNISSYLLSPTELQCWDKLIKVIKNNRKVDGVVQYRFR